jgi:hypothetical protein
MSRKHIVVSTGDKLKIILVILSEGDSEENQQHSFLNIRLQVTGLIKLISFQFAHIKFDHCYITSCDNNP